MRVYEIPPKQNYEAVMHKRVAAYCRVSTSDEKQATSINNQKNYYTNAIEENPRWENAGIFVDIGSGKNLKNRSEFVKMMKYCRKGKIDIILTKSISRFGRNTLDALKAFNELRNLGVDVWFEVENITLLSPTSGTILAMLSAFAQDESESKSSNIKWGIAHSFKDVDSKFSHFTCYGYTKDDKGWLVPDEKQADVVRMIFRLYLEGYSLNGISKELEKQEVLSPTGKPKWSNQTIDKLLSNEKYVGEVMLQKTYIPEFFEGKQVKNTGQRERYIVSNHHEPIVSKEDFDRVQEEKKRRSNVKQNDKGKTIRTETRYSQNALSGMLKCCECGKNYRRITRSNGDVIWRCANRVEQGNRICKNSPTVKDVDLVEWLEKNEVDLNKTRAGSLVVGIGGMIGWG